jgi:succinyl-diaminopimelate desuccinylase
MAMVDEYLEQHRERFEDELCEWLRIPSVSADGRHRADVVRASEWVAEQFRRLNLTTRVISTDRHPLVYAESPPVPSRPVALVYGHYDVQPPDPLDEWTTPPFEPARRDGKLYARGATDDKGQLFTHIKSVEAWTATQGELPLQVKFLIEGAEEVGSEELVAFLGSDEGPRQLACDVVVISDTSQFAEDVPAITYGLRGIAYFEVSLRGPRQDLHSGVFGGAVTNPAIALAKLLAALIDADGRIQVPGFYDDVQPLSDRERQQFAELPFDEQAFQRQLGVNGLSGEKGYSTLERRWVRPTFDIHGLTSGYQGEGGKTVLPARASAKFSFRLVPRQDPEKIAKSLRQMFAGLCPPGIELQLDEMSHAAAHVVPLDSPYMEAAARAVQHGFGRPPVFMREGGSIPIVKNFADTLGVDTLLLGWGLDDDNAHSPNEKFSLRDFHRGIRSSARLWQELSQLAPRTTGLGKDPHARS